MKASSVIANARRGKVARRERRARQVRKCAAGIVLKTLAGWLHFRRWCSSRHLQKMAEVTMIVRSWTAVARALVGSYCVPSMRGVIGRRLLGRSLVGSSGPLTARRRVCACVGSRVVDARLVVARERRVSRLAALGASHSLSEPSRVGVRQMLLLRRVCGRARGRGRASRRTTRFRFGSSCGRLRVCGSPTSRAASRTRTSAFSCAVLTARPA